MKVLKATLAFVMGLVLGIILLVVAIGGTIFALGTTRTVGELQSAVTDQTIIQPDSDLYSQSVLEAVKQVLHDYQNFDELSLALLYKHYGIDLLKGLSGLDFTQKSFYDKPLTYLIDNISELLDDIYLSDIETLADLDFSEYNLPILDENMNVGITKAVDNILKTFKGDLSLRLIQAKLGLSFGVENNDILMALQDVNLKEIGGLIDALRISTLLKADTDTYLPRAIVPVYVSTEGTEEEWEVVSDADLANADYVPELGIETYISGGGKTQDGKSYLIEKELRYYQKEDGTRVVDNSCYSEGWQKPEGVTVVRHRLFKRYTGNGSAGNVYYIQGFANHVDSVDAAGKFTLLHKQFLSLDDITVGESGARIDKALIAGGELDLRTIAISYSQKDEESGATTYQQSGDFSVFDAEISESSMLRLPDKDENYVEGRGKYVRAHMGASSPLLQYINYLSIGYLRSDTDEILKHIRIGDIIDTEAEGVADILKALKNSTLDSIGKDINTIPFGQMFQNESNNQLLNAIQDFTLENIDKKIGELKLGQVIDVTGNPLLESLQNSTLDNISEEINNVPIASIVGIDDDTPQLLIALSDRGATLGNISDIMNDLTVAELFEIDFDAYTLAPGGAYARNYDYVLLDPQLPDSTMKMLYGEAPKRYRLDGDEYVEDNENGEYVQFFYYVLYDESVHAGQERYNLDKEGETALAVQSLARRGVKALEMGNELNSLSIGELMRVSPDSAQLFKALSRKGSTLETITTDANDLEVGDLVEIDEKSSKIMRSLVARHCKLSDMDTITDELTMEEMLDIVPDKYTKDEFGIYVHVTDPNGYVPYEEDDWRADKFVLVDGEYVEYDPATHGDAELFVHSAYYTLYNPAVHNAANPDIEFEKDGDAIARFSKQEPVEGDPVPSSKILQRFAGSTMGSFTTAFDGIMLSEVMDIEADIYAAIPSMDIQHDTNGYFYGADKFEEGKLAYKYDAENGVYSVADQRDFAAAVAGTLTLYHVEQNGAAPSILKKLAYVRVNEMASALDVVMKDMVLSEIIDIHVYDAVSALEDFTYTGGEEGMDSTGLQDKRFFIPWDGETAINEQPIVFVYEATGKYIVRDEYYRAITERNTATYLGAPTTQYFKYEPYQLEFGSDMASKAEALLRRIETGNVYITDQQDDGSMKYIYNVALATYYATSVLNQLTSASSLEQVTGVNEQLSRLVYKQKSDAGDDDAIEYIAYKDIPEEYKEKIYVEMLGKKSKDTYGETGEIEGSEPNYYDPDDPFHSDLPKYVLLRDGQDHIVPLNVPEYDYKDGTDVRIGTQYAREVMIKQGGLEEAKAAALDYISSQTDGREYCESKGCDKVYVFLPSTNSYEAYDENNAGHNLTDAQYYTKQIGYVAQYGEVFYDLRSTGKCVTKLKFKIATVEREHSSKVLTLLANKTINDMNSAIERATINDFMDVTPGTIFDDEAIRKSTLGKLGTTLAAELSDMTIGKLLEWGSVTTIDAQVRTILNDVTLTQFFGALTYKDGTIVLDMEALYGIHLSSPREP